MIPPEHNVAREIVRTVTSDIDSYTMRSVVKSAIKELIAEEAAAGGLWLFKAAAYMVVGAVVLFVLWANGWRHP